ncbi:hypothetical protein [Aquimarina megaterium]|uniref:hypothetical protein n=1 Tax=Aquimarina megaterium TaxID=1443666 RepID=UPI00046FCCE4|nr:hypothetical protein [Aquimarina megaterium]
MKNSIMGKLNLNLDYLISREELKFINGGTDSDAGDGGSKSCYSDDDCEEGCIEYYPDRNYGICSGCCIA